MFRIPVPNPPLDLAKKVEAALLREVPKVANQVCNGMFATSAAVPLKNGDGFGGPRNVVAFVGQDFSLTPRYQMLCLVLNPNPHRPRLPLTDEMAQSPE